MKVNVSAIIAQNKKVLLMQRDINDKHFPGHWGIPGGGMEESDESIEATAIREVAEELGLHIKPVAVRYNNRFNDVLFIVVTATLSNPEEFSKTLNISKEVFDYEWVDIKALKGKQFTPFTEARIVEVLEEISSDDKK